jgi:hypothetical protein
MNKAIVLSLVFLAAIPVPAFSGCANYTDGSLSSPAPNVIICYSDKCDKTTLEWECGNVFGAGFKYTVGWQVNYEINEQSKKKTVKILWKGREIDTADHKYLSCYPIDEDKEGCGFPKD